MVMMPGMWYCVRYRYNYNTRYATTISLPTGWQRVSCDLHGGTPLDGAMTLAESVRKEVAALRVPVGEGEWRGSISVGVAARTATMTTLRDLIKAADEGLYVAKRNGRNCVATSDQ